MTKTLSENLTRVTYRMKMNWIEGQLPAKKRSTKPTKFHPLCAVNDSCVAVCINSACKVIRYDEYRSRASRYDAPRVS